jgi:hypothetical protein
MSSTKPNTTPTPNKTPAIIFAGIFVLGFLLCGIFLILDSNTQYQKSLDYAERSIKDSSRPPRLNFTPNYTVIKDSYAEARLYFTLALGIVVLVLLLPRLQNINIGSGGISLTLKDLPQKVEALTTQANAMQAISAGEGGIKKAAALAIPRASGDPTSALLGQAAESRIDTQKGKWGEKAENNWKKLSARVTDSAMPGLFTVILTVEGTNPNAPLKGLVHFHLHHSFSNPDPIIVAQDNSATLTLNRVYGAFTVGVETDRGHTRLELDLAKIPDAPDGFK